MGEKLCIIGNGMAATRLMEQLINDDNCPFDIHVFSNEKHAGYNRVLLSPLLSGEQKLDDIITHTESWYAENHITLHLGINITRIDREQKYFLDQNDKKHSYDKLIIATGSNPFIPPIPGHEIDGVYAYRTIDDVDRFIDIAGHYKNAVVIGGGVLGLEAAYGLKKRGMNVTVLHRDKVLMERQLDKTASTMLIDTLTSSGIQIMTEANTKEFTGNDRLETVVLEDGRKLEADLVIMAIGVRPNIVLAREAGLELERGILVNDQLQTSDESIYSVGECVQHRGINYGLVAPLYEQAAVCAAYLNGDKQACYEGSITATGLKVTGVSLFSGGQFHEDEDCRVITLLDNDNRIYRKLVLKHNVLIGVLLYGDVTGSLWYQELMQEKTDVSEFQEILMFGPDYLPEEKVTAK